MTSNWRLRIIRGALAVAILSLAGSCATQQEGSQPPLAPTAASPPAPALPILVAKRINAKPSNTVRATYQGDEYAGHRTASGEPYDPDALTAASRTLPIGSSVVVTNLATGRSVKLRINDRGGPGVRGRGLDLSKRAAEEIGMTRKGVARVKVKRVDSKSEKSESPNSPASSSATSTPKS
jgi:rare lipoprotein A